MDSAVGTWQHRRAFDARVVATLTGERAIGADAPPRGGNIHLVTLTENAGEKLKVLLADEGDDLRVQVAPGGCSSFEYQLTVGKPHSDDEIVDEHGVRIIIDRFSAPYRFGAERGAGLTPAFRPGRSGRMPTTSMRRRICVLSGSSGVLDRIRPGSARSRGFG